MFLGAVHAHLGADHTPDVKTHGLKRFKKISADDLSNPPSIYLGCFPPEKVR